MGDPLKVYKDLRAQFQTQPPVTLEDSLWLQDPYMLKKEMRECANTNSTATLESIEAMNPESDDWLPLLSHEERQRYEKYLNQLGIDPSSPKFERVTRGVAVGQDPDVRFMAGSDDSNLGLVEVVMHFVHFAQQDPVNRRYRTSDLLVHCDVK